MKLLVVSVLGGRSAIAMRHLECLTMAARSVRSLGHVVDIVVYVTAFNNHRLLDVVADAERGGELTVEVKSRRNLVSSTLDYDYDEMLDRHLDDHDAFLLLHDDTMINEELLCVTLELLNDSDVVAYLDSNRTLEYYRKVKVDGAPLSEIRLGTWFFSAKKVVWTEAAQGFGCGSFFSRQAVLDIFMNPRVVVDADYVWLNGGALFNIDLRLKERSIVVLDEILGHQEKYHLNAAVNTFIKSKWLSYGMMDKPEENETLLRRISALRAEQQRSAIDKFAQLVVRYEEFGIQDYLVNRSTLECLRQQGDKRHFGVVSMVAEGCQPNSLYVCSWDSVDEKHIGESRLISFTHQARDAGINRIVLGLNSEPCDDPMLCAKIQAVKTACYDVCIEIATKKTSDSLHAKLLEAGAEGISVPVESCISDPRDKTADNDPASGMGKDVNRVEGPNDYWPDAGDRVAGGLPSRWQNQRIARTGLRHVEYEFVRGCIYNYYKEGVFIGDSGDFQLCPFDIDRQIYLGGTDCLTVKEFINHDMRRMAILRIEGGAQDVLPCHFCPNRIAEV